MARPNLPDALSMGENPLDVPMGATGGHAAVSRRFVLQLARALHKHGTPAHRLETALAITARRLGLEAEFFSTPTSIMVGIGNLDDQRVSLLRVEPGEPNLGHLSTLGDITRGVIEGTLSPAEGLHQVEALDSEPPPYPQWLVLFAFVCSSAAVSCFLKVRAGDVLTASLLGLLTGALAIFAGRRESTRHVTEPLVAFVVTTVAFTIDGIMGTRSGFATSLAGVYAVGDVATVVDNPRFRALFDAPAAETEAAVFDRLFENGDVLHLGEAEIHVMHTPGHTPACVTYVVDDAAFVGDTLFMPDYGTARADFPGGDAGTLYHSIRRILDLPASTRIFVGHDYLPPGRAQPQWETSVAEQRACNLHVHDGVSEAEFVAMRSARDKTLAAPRLILPSLQVNIRGGALPKPNKDGRVFLMTPVNAF